MRHFVASKLALVLAATRYAISLPLDSVHSDTFTDAFSDSPLSSATITSSVLNDPTPTILPHSFLRHPTIRPRASNQYGPIIAFAVIGGLVALVVLYSVTHALWDQYHRRARQNLTAESNESGMDIDELARELHRHTADASLWDECRTRGRTERAPVNRISESDCPPPPPYGAGECVPSYEDSETRYSGSFLGYVPVVAVNINMVMSESRGGENSRTPHYAAIEGYVSHSTV